MTWPLDLKSASGDSTNTNDIAFPIALPMSGEEGEVGASIGPLAPGLAAAFATGGGSGNGAGVATAVAGARASAACWSQTGVAAPDKVPVRVAGSDILSLLQMRCRQKPIRDRVISMAAAADTCVGDRAADHGLRSSEDDEHPLLSDHGDSRGIVALGRVGERAATTACSSCAMLRACDL